MEFYKLIQALRKDIYTKIDEQINKFWEWSKLQVQILEWETNYPNWTLIYTLTEKLFDITNYTEWDRRTINNLLYIIARDNECEVIIEELTNNPEDLLFLSKEALRFPDSDARWQFAHYLSKIAHQYPEAKEIMLKYVYDHVEYVRRRATEAIRIIS